MLRTSKVTQPVRPTLPRIALVVLLTLLAWVLATCATARPALAHAALVASSPSELQILTDPPSAVLLVFDEGVSPALSTITVTGPGRLTVPVGRLTQANHGVLYLSAPLSGRLPVGDYQVRWRAVSTDDGHPTAGEYSFRTLIAAVVRSAPANGSTTPAAVGGGARTAAQADGGFGSRLVFGVARWIAFLGFAALVGALYFLVACWPEGSSRRGWCRLVVGGWFALTGATLTMVISYGAYAEGASLTKLADVSLLQATLASHIGGVLLLRFALLVTVAGLAVVLVRWRPVAAWAAHRAGRPVVLAFGAGLAATWSAISHSDSSAHAAPMVALDVLHMLSTAVWLGGLAALGVVVLGKRQDPVVAGRAAATFSSTALVCVVVLVATGSLQAWQRVGSLAALNDNAYARLLLGKLALVALTLLLAAAARFRLVRRQPPTKGKPRPAHATAMARLRRLVLAEVGLGVAVLTVTSVLVSTEPARAAHAQVVAARRTPSVQATPVKAAAVVASLSGQIPYDAGQGASGRGDVALGVQTPRVGATEIHLSVLDASGVPRQVVELTAALRRPAYPNSKPTLVSFVKISPGHYVSRGASFTAPGSWQLGIALRLPSGGAAIAVAGISVTG